MRIFLKKTKHSYFLIVLFWCLDNLKLTYKIKSILVEDLIYLHCVLYSDRLKFVYIWQSKC